MTYQPTKRDPEEALPAARELLPWREAAALLEVKPHTVARWIDRGRLPYVLIDGRRHVAITEASRVEAETRHRGGKRR